MPSDITVVAVTISPCANANVASAILLKAISKLLTHDRVFIVVGDNINFILLNSITIYCLALKSALCFHLFYLCRKKKTMKLSRALSDLVKYTQSVGLYDIEAQGKSEVNHSHVLE